MIHIKFTKMHGTGNDFIIVEAGPFDIDWSKLAVAMCHRRFGVGADGLILVLPSAVADLRMRIFNADGSEAEMCGNGIRCIARYATTMAFVKPSLTEISIETLAGIRKTRLIYEKGLLTSVQVGMGLPEFQPEKIPVNIEPGHSAPIKDYPLTVDKKKRLSLTFVSMGNPHAVYFIKYPVSDFPITEVGPLVENHATFPRRINFEVARVLENNTIEVRAWERGAGDTLACGTGACAVAVAARLHGYVNDEVDIILPGGTLRITWDGKGEVFLSGPASVVFSGEWTLEENN